MFMSYGIVSLGVYCEVESAAGCCRLVVYLALALCLTVQYYNFTWQTGYASRSVMHLEA